MQSLRTSTFLRGVLFADAAELTAVVDALFREVAVARALALGAAGQPRHVEVKELKGGGGVVMMICTNSDFWGTAVILKFYYSV
ncbi:MAG: hypothetical protein ABW250_23820 [Pyrinomonadaceae bacterium]